MHQIKSDETRRRMSEAAKRRWEKESKLSNHFLNKGIEPVKVNRKKQKQKEMIEKYHLFK